MPGFRTGRSSATGPSPCGGSDLRVSLLSGRPGLTIHVEVPKHDQLFQLTEGSITVVPADGSRKSQFHAGSEFILTHTFKGDLVTRAGFKAVVAEPRKQPTNPAGHL